MKTSTLIRIFSTGLLLAQIGSASTWAAIINVPVDEPTIQAAVDAAVNGDTIQIAPGIYLEQVQVSSKKLTLIGQPGTILRATEQMSVFPFPDTTEVPILGVRYSEITLQGLTFEGERLAEHFPGPGVADLVGLFLGQSSANVENCAFYGFRESTPTSEDADAIVVINFAANIPAVNVRLVGNTIADTYSGIFAVGLPSQKSINITIENNTIIGPGPLDTKALTTAGIFIREGIGGRIAGNTISGFSYTGTTADFPISFGILAAHESNYPRFGVLQPLEIEGNILRDNQMHIALVNGDGCVLKNNRLQGSAPGSIPVGMTVSGKNVTIAENVFENLPEGIRLLGNDPLWGTSIGIAVGAQVTSNSFCGVTAPINLEPQASATEEGTLSCAAPVLNIGPAVLLSWPRIQDGYGLETAPSPDGPWTPSDATAFLQQNQLSRAVLANDGTRFFRLRKL